MFDLNCSGVIDLLEEVTLKAPEYIDKVLKVFDDFEEIKSRLVDAKAARFEKMHKRFAMIVRNRVIRYAVRETNKPYDEIAEAFDRVITEENVEAACAECDMSIPTADSNFSEEARKIDWLKIGKIVFKIFMILLPFLMMAAQIVPETLPQTLDELRSLFIQKNTKIQAINRMFVGTVDKRIFSGLTNLILTNDKIAGDVIEAVK